MATDLVTDWTVQWGVAPGRLPSCLQDVTQPEGMREIRNGRDKLGHHRAPDRSRAPLTVLGGRDPASPVPTSAYAVSSPLDSSPPKDRREPCPYPNPSPMSTERPRAVYALWATLGLHPKLIIRRTKIYGLRTHASAFKQQTLETVQVDADFLNPHAKSDAVMEISSEDEKC